jgi:hypothetical protein
MNTFQTQSKNDQHEVKQLFQRVFRIQIQLEKLIDLDCRNTDELNTISTELDELLEILIKMNEF